MASHHMTACSKNVPAATIAQPSQGAVCEGRLEKDFATRKLKEASHVAIAGNFHRPNNRRYAGTL
jgi:hypothetical protein